jgi:hypothetical protein
MGILENDELNHRLMTAAKRDPNRDAKPIITGWMSEQYGDAYDEILSRVEPKSDEADTVQSEPEVTSNDTPPPPETDSEDELPDLPDLPPVKEDSAYRDPNIRALKTPMQVNESLERIKRLSGL